MHDDLIAAATATTTDDSYGVTEWPGRCPRCGELYLNLPAQVRAIIGGYATC